MTKNKSHKASAVARNALPVNKLKRDPGVPKLNLKQRMVDKVAQRVRHTQRLGADGMVLDSMQTIAGLAASTSLSAAESNENSADGFASLYAKLSEAGSGDPTLTAHAHQFKKVLELADVILQVLDARDPLGCRSKIVEEEVLRSAGNKKIILVLNKTDLVPKENVQAWLKYLRHDFPTIPFKSSTQQQRSNLSTATGSKSASKGAPHLLHLLKSIRPAHSSITVGVLGPPNVGKSSLINSIKRERVCTVGAKPGETKALKEVAVERGIRVIDSPGIVWGDSEEGGVLRNIWSLEGLEDPALVVEGIVGRVPAETLQTMYGVPPFKDTQEFLTMVSLVRGKLGKGGKPDLNTAALAIVHDWNIGKIPFYTVPPSVHPSMIPRESLLPPPTQPAGDATMEEDAETASKAAAFATTRIVTEWGKPFNLEGLWAAADNDVLGDGDGDGEMLVEDADGFAPGDDSLPMDDDANEMQSDDLTPIIPSKRPVTSSQAPTPALSSGRHTPNAMEGVTGRKPRPQKEKRPPKRPRVRTQRLAPSGPDEELLLSTMNPLSRKRIKEDAKKRKKDTKKHKEVGGDIEMPIES